MAAISDRRYMNRAEYSTQCKYDSICTDISAYLMLQQVSVYSLQLYAYVFSHRSTLIQDIQHGNRGCENTQDGMKKSHLLLAAAP